MGTEAFEGRSQRDENDVNMAFMDEIRKIYILEGKWKK